MGTRGDRDDITARCTTFLAEVDTHDDSGTHHHARRTDTCPSDAAG